MKAILHKQSVMYRVIQRGKLYFVQHKGDANITSSREHDPWYDIGKAREDVNAALGAMYTRLPMRVAV